MSYNKNTRRKFLKSEAGFKMTVQKNPVNYFTQGGIRL